ncbi:hypothetical protein COU57_04915 [Candidatus Pacearchaeota archaeon CG10_big_fil_rev_8_21_14_0_10_32_14]|nr:MAG: hypothetical protein COU57_04915 [Candidatus Pacearchaeota archaeon CG10_big_fil_rev_8_21_14_0_10_32_14]
MLNTFLNRLFYYLSMDINQSQVEVWNSIAPEWHGFKVHPSQHVKQFLEDFKGKEFKILDHGSGSGRHILDLPKKFESELYFVDFSSEMIKLAKKRAKESKLKNINFDVADIASLPYEDNFFDALFSIASIHCQKKELQEKTVQEIYRILKPGGKALIEVWNKHSNRFEKHKGQEKMVRWRDKGKRYYYLFEENEIHSIFEKNNLKIIKKLEHGVNISFIVEKSS